MSPLIGYPLRCFAVCIQLPHNAAANRVRMNDAPTEKYIQTYYILMKAKHSKNELQSFDRAVDDDDDLQHISLPFLQFLW